MRDDVENYFSIRRQLIAEEEAHLFGSDLDLDYLERKANEVLMRCKNEEITLGLCNE